MYPRSQQASIDKAEETRVQIMSAFGKKHLLAAQAAALVVAITEEAELALKSKTLLEVFKDDPPSV